MNESVKKVLVFLLLLLLIPFIMFASTDESLLPLRDAIPMEIFLTLLISLGVLKPLSEIISLDNSKKIFWILFIIRIGYLLYFVFFVTTKIVLFEFISFWVVAIILDRIKTAKERKNKGVETQSESAVLASHNTLSKPAGSSGIELRCVKCNNIMKISDKFCTKCGAPFDGNNIKVVENADSSVDIPTKVDLSPSNFDSIYRLTENRMLEAFITKELTKADFDSKSKLIPSEILKRKKILNLIFAILVFVFVSLIFFHFPRYTYAIGAIILLIFFIITRRYNLMKYLVKQVKSRPSEKISNIIMNVKNTSDIDNTKGTLALYLIIAIVVPLIAFSTPKIIYEKVDGGYAVRYYAFGLTNYKTATIPGTHNGQKVVALRGNTFSNMYYLESVKLPDSIKEIRGEAFLNCTKLSEVNMPKELEYLGGGAFYNAKSLRSIELPDTLTYLGGEAFYNAISLEHVKLSNNLGEIRGNTFENCYNLKSISIPDSVTRIGGHAFYGDFALSEVAFTENSQLVEIGSSAFRNCSSLNEITLPKNAVVNSRAFKGSPTMVNRFN